MKLRIVLNNVKLICVVSELLVSLIKNKCYILVGELKIKGLIYFKWEVSFQKLKKVKNMISCMFSINCFLFWILWR